MAQWTREAMEILVDLYENYPTLYAVKSTDYHNRNLKRTAMEELTKQLNIRLNKNFNVEEVKSKVTKLRSQFIENMGKIKASKASGARAEDVYKPTWFLFNHLRFIVPHILHRKGKSNLKDSTASSSCTQHDTQELDTEFTQSQAMSEEDIQVLPASPVYTELPVEDGSRTDSTVILDIATPTTSKSNEPRQAIKRKMNVQAEDFFKEARQAVEKLTAVPKNVPSTNVDELDHFFNYLKAETRNLKTDAQGYVKKIALM
ncbi:Dpt-YFP repressor by overexpression [Carabus blaptoides fortunei]